METNDSLGSFRSKDVIQVLIGIPAVAALGILLATWATSYAGL